MDVLRLDWPAFDRAVSAIAEAVRDQCLWAVHGLPRGGSPLAVALSHRLGVPAPALMATPNHEEQPATDPASKLLLVDDIYDSGRTLAPWLGRDDILPWVWVTRQAQPQGYQAVLTDIGTAWVLFPWEDPQRLTQDRQDYQTRRPACTAADHRTAP